MANFIRNICCVVSLLISSAAIAQDARFELHAPTVVTVGEIFTVEFVIGEKYNDNSFMPPRFEGFNVVAGPSIIQSSSTSIDAGGNVVRNTSYGFSYALQASAAGTFTIQPGKIAVGDKAYATRATPIEVVNAEAVRDPNSQTAADDDILLRVVVDRTTVYKGEPVRATFKLYRRQVQMSGTENMKIPAFNGFWTQVVDFDRQNWKRETYNNKVYDTFVLHDVLLYPLQSGTINIEPMSLDIIVSIVKPLNTGNAFFDSFIGGHTLEEVRKHVASVTVPITVKELPAGAPASFNGAVGSFQMSGGLSNSNVTVNGSSKYTIRISGRGNLPQINQPKITFPSSFEQYPVTSSDRLGQAGGSGYKEFEYPFIARSEGAYTIEQVDFTYFDPAQQRYVTLSNPSVSVDVHADSLNSGSSERGIVSGVSREEVKLLGNDIRFIHVDDKNWSKRGSVFFLSWPYFAVIIILLAVSVGIYFYLRKYMREISDAALLRNKKANKIARSRLKAAAGFMDSGDEHGFYEEMLHAMWGYMSDKLNMPVANLTKDNIREELLKRGVAQEKAEEFIEIISVCEYAQYSPQSGGRMNEIYNRTALLLSKIETVIK